MYATFLLPLLAISPALALPSQQQQPRTAASPSSSDLYRVPLTAHTSRQLHPELEVRQAWLKSQARGLRRKYSDHLGERSEELARRDKEEEASLSRRALEPRASGSVSLTDIGIDASYSGTVAIGTPAQDFLVIMDTGSADLWVAGSTCTSSSCEGTTTYAASSSSSYSTSNAEFNITYGSGDADGYLAADNVAMGGFTVTGQTFAVVTSTTANLISAPLSGLMGLAWKTIAASGATPFWQALASSGQWSDSEMGVYLGRYRGVLSATTVETNGGEIVFGGLDTSKYTGSVNYIEIDSRNLDYWRIPVQAMTVQNSSVSVSSSSTSSYSSDVEAAIDTGTTLIGVPSSVAQAIYAQIPGSAAFSESSGYSGYYQYPCSTDVTVTLQFGGYSYAISNEDMNLGSFSKDTSLCTGAFFEMDLSPSSPIKWIVGASFLKNVYSAFRYNPSAIGFAQLASGVSNISNGTATSTNSSTTGGGTSGSGGTTGSGGTSGSGSSGTGSSSSSGAGLSAVVGGSEGWVVGTAVLGAVIAGLIQ